jgi:hypothetical protein
MKCVGWIIFLVQTPVRRLAGFYDGRGAAAGAAEPGALTRLWEEKARQDAKEEE